MKKLFLLLLTNISLFAGLLSLDQIDTTILLKNRTPVNVKLSIALQGRDIEESEIELIDVVQTVIGGFWAESLVTTQGKQQFKKMVIDLANKQYGIEIDFVYIRNIRIETNPLEQCRELLKRR